LPTLVPADPFDPNGDAGRLFDAIDGWGTDENKIVSVLCYRTASQREVITATYNSQHGVRKCFIFNKRKIGPKFKKKMSN
jgi:annexin A7/11